MVDFSAIIAFSHSHCIAICAFLVPMNLLATLQTILWIGLDRKPRSIGLMATVANLYALMMVLHVLSWLIVGVVMAPTYILFGLGSLCLAINLWALIHPSTMKRTIHAIASGVSEKLQRKGKNRFFPFLVSGSIAHSSLRSRQCSSSGPLG